MLFTIVQVQLKRANQSALVMAKLVQLFAKVKIEEDDKSHFYEQFGTVVKHLLSIKEFNVFLTVLASFMEWAKVTDLDDLNFMVPDDPTVQNLLSNYMQNSKIDIDSTCPLDTALAKFRKIAFKNGLKDSDIIEKFCKPVKKLKFNFSNRTEVIEGSSRAVKSDVPELAQKLVEIEFLMSGKPTPSNLTQLVEDMYKEFKSQTWPNGGSTEELKGFINKK